MKKYILLAVSALMLAACAGRRAQAVDDLTMALEVEIISEAKYDAFALQARRDTLPGLEVLFLAARDVKTVHVRELTGILKAYDISPCIEIPGISYDSDNLVNLKAAIASENYMTDLYQRVLKNLPRKDTASSRETVTRLLDNCLRQLSLLQSARDSLTLTPEPGKDIAFRNYHVCRQCGDLFVDSLPGECSRCGAASSYFRAVHPEMSYTGAEPTGW